MVIIKRDNNNKMGKKKTYKNLSNNKIERLVAITFYIRVEIWLMPIKTENTHKVHIMVKEH